MSKPEQTNALQTLSRAIQGFIFCLVLIFFSLSSVEIFGQYFRLAFLPFAGLFLWPLQASKRWSLVFVFILGVLYDIFSGGPMGIWALSFLIYFIAVNEGIRGIKDKLGWLQALGLFFVTLIFLGAIAAVLNRVSLGIWPSRIIIVNTVVVTLIAFPLIYWIRNLLSFIGGEPQENRGLQ
ncbi:MAG: hypothetical protein V3U57_05250 [Robiginitomaculum sp.]